MKLTDLINLLAVILIPIAAVIIGQFLQDRSEKRKDKMKIVRLDGVAVLKLLLH